MLRQIRKNEAQGWRHVGQDVSPSWGSNFFIIVNMMYFMTTGSIVLRALEANSVCNHYLFTISTKVIFLNCGQNRNLLHV